jgi:hypothetical protein
LPTKITDLDLTEIQPAVRAISESERVFMLDFDIDFATQRNLALTMKDKYGKMR